MAGDPLTTAVGAKVASMVMVMVILTVMTIIMMMQWMFLLQNDLTTAAGVKVDVNDDIDVGTMIMILQLMSL